MAIVKINLHKVNAERNLENQGGQVNINSNVSLTNCEPLSFNAEGKKGLKFTFSFTSTYEPNIGKIEVAGQVLFVETSSVIEEIKASWDKDKKVPTKVTEQIINAALHKGNIQAIKISEDVSLPSPLRLPKVKSKE